MYQRIPFGAVGGGCDLLIGDFHFRPSRGGVERNSRRDAPRPRERDPSVLSQALTGSSPDVFLKPVEDLFVLEARILRLQHDVTFVRERVSLIPAPIIDSPRPR